MCSGDAFSMIIADWFLISAYVVVMHVDIDLKIPVFWDVTPFSLAEEYGYFRGYCCLQYQV
jgi:hypothetical protein